MPGGDRTGPMGMGPMTGRAAGYCVGNNAPGYMNPVGGRGMGFGGGRGFGRGMGRGFRGGFRGAGYAAGYGWAPMPVAPTAQQEKDALQSQAEYLEGALKDIQQRLGELEKDK